MNTKRALVGLMACPSALALRPGRSCKANHFFIFKWGIFRPKGQMTQQSALMTFKKLLGSVCSTRLWVDVHAYLQASPEGGTLMRVQLVSTATGPMCLH